MDRDKRWDRVALAYDAMVDAKGERATTPKRGGRQGLRRQARRRVRAADGDRRLCRHEGRRRRPDVQLPLRPRARDPDGAARSAVRRLQARQARDVRRGRRHGRVFGRAQPASSRRCFRPQSIKMGLGETVSQAGLKQLRIAETEKYAHVTFFFNGGEERVFDGEERILVPSPKVADLRPEARDERAGSDRQAGRGDRLGQVRPDRGELRQHRHGRPYRRSLPPPSRRSKRSMPASAG